MRAVALFSRRRLSSAEPVETRHVHVGNDEMDRLGDQRLQRRHAVFGDDDALHAHLVERIDNQRPADRGVVDHHDRSLSAIDIGQLFPLDVSLRIPARMSPRGS